ncbi:MAG: hypothetical protein RIQ93_1407 [Verrucomicrobiota bacterium]|jgi:hypothetical protein
MNLTRRRGRTFLLTLQITAVVWGFASQSRGEVQIERIFMPNNAYPSSFAIGLPGGINFCFDPVRGGVSYVWTGGFIDPTSARNGIGKFVDAVKLLGPVVYQESGNAPLRRGDKSRAPVVGFSGYTLRVDSVEFRYTVDGAPVREEIRARPGAKGLERRLHIEGSSDAKWWYVAEGRTPVELRPDAGGIFLLEVPLEKGAP